MTPVHVAIAGATGRMGAALLQRLAQEPDFTLVGLAARLPPGSERTSLAGITVQETLDAALGSGAGAAQVAIDFSHASATAEHAEACAAKGAALVIGSTGLSPADRTRVERAAQRIPIVMAPNMSVAVNALFRITAELAKVLGPGYDVEVLEAHHRMKRDAPSGTALRLAEGLAKARGVDASAFRLERAGQIGERPAQEIGVQTLRGGDVVGDHTVYFFGDGERLEVTHRATSRGSFAQGAFRAARFLVGKPPGLYDMQDVLGFSRG